MRDPYEVLNVSRSATPDDIKRQYRKLAKQLHPDLNPGNKAVETQFKEATAAYDFLSNPEKRARYDRGEIDAEGHERMFRQSSGAGADAGGPFAGFDIFGGEEIFTDLFSHAGRKRQSAQVKGADLSYTMELEFLEAVRGAKKRVQFSDGRILDIAVPAGAEDSQILRLKGQGGAGFAGGPAGDAYITLKVKPHRHFRRVDTDIHLDVPISLKEAVMGAAITVPTIHGRVSLKIPKGASSGTKLRLRGQGVTPASGNHGDQYVHLSIVLPHPVDPALEAFLRNWSPLHPQDARAEWDKDFS